MRILLSIDVESKTHRLSTLSRVSRGTDRSFHSTEWLSERAETRDTSLEFLSQLRTTGYTSLFRDLSLSFETPAPFLFGPSH